MRPIKKYHAYISNKTQEVVLYADHLGVTEPLELSRLRYDKVRRMHPVTWLRIYNKALMGEGTFDELVDQWKGEL